MLDELDLPETEVKREAKARDVARLSLHCHTKTLLGRSVCDAGAARAGFRGAGAAMLSYL